MAGITSTVSTVEDKRPKRSETASPWKMGSRRMKAAPTLAAGVA
jgi:hypothetical protein